MSGAVALEQSVIVAGHPRSGTSLVCQLLESAGVSFPTDIEADQYNRDGYYELHESKELSKSLIDEAMTEENTKRMNAVVRRLNEIDGWSGLKLVRIPAFFFYAHVAKELTLVGVFRDPANVRASQFRRGISSFSPRWFKNNNALIAGYENTENALLIRYESLLREPDRVSERLADLGFDVRTDLIDRSKTTQAESQVYVRPEERELYERLCTVEHGSE